MCNLPRPPLPHAAPALFEDFVQQIRQAITRPRAPPPNHPLRVRDNGDGTLSVDMSDGSSYGPFAMPAGPQGPQGEVSAADLSFAIGGTSANSNTVQPLGLTISDPPTQSELQAVVNKIDELIQALRR